MKSQSAFKKRNRNKRLYSIFSPMKILYFLLCFGIAQGYAGASYAQKVSVSADKMAIKNFLAAIHSQTGYDFLYDDDLLRHAKPVTVKAVNQPLKSVMDIAMKGQPFDYEIKGKLILFKKKLPVAKEASIVAQQDYVVRGTVLDENEKVLSGVSVWVKNAQNATATAEDGQFVLRKVKADDLLVFSYYGYQTLEVELKGQTSLRVQMTQEAKGLEEVVVVGYGTQKKVNLTGAVDQVKGDLLENRALPNISQGLQGTIPNLNIVPLDGKPTQSPAFNIRGTTSISQETNALVLIDGVEGDPSRLNPSDVATVSVLKDAASAAIYGARGAFGVVLITTKNASKGATSINYSYNHAVKEPVTRPDFVTDGYTFATMFADAHTGRYGEGSGLPSNINGTMTFSQEYLDEFARRAADPSLPTVEVDPATGQYVYYASTDWYSELYKNNTNARDHNINISGSQEKSDFYISGRMFDQDGIFRYNSDDYQMLNLRAKGSLQVFPWLKVTNNMDYSGMKYHNPLVTGQTHGIWRALSDHGQTNAPMFNPDGTLTHTAAYSVGDFWYGRNGLDTDRRVFRNTSSMASSFLNNQLRINADFTFQQTHIGEQQVEVPVPFSRTPGVIEYVRGATTDQMKVSNGRTDYLATNIYAEYEPKLNESHYFKALVGFNNEQSTYSSLAVTRNGILFEDATNFNMAQGELINPAADWDRWVIRGGFYRLNYAYKERYLLEANGRYDGSSKFPSDQRFAFFPSISGGWRINKEAFWKVSPKIITELKLRGSYGSLGNGNIDSYMFQQQFVIEQSEDRVLNGALQQQTSQPEVLPAGLTWETSTTTNIGLDIGLLSNRLFITAEKYIRKTTNMYTVGMTLPAVFGADPPHGNYADLETRGWELAVQWHDQFRLAGKPFNYGIRVNMADYQATILAFNNPNGLLPNNETYYAGQKVGEIWGFTTEGLFQSAEEIANSANQALYMGDISTGILPGDIKFADLNGDGVINKGDETISNPGDLSVIGNTTPRYTYGINLNADWNRFSISMFFQGVGKQDWYPGTEAAIFWGQYNRAYNKVPSWQLGNIWSEDNPDAYLPRYRASISQNAAGTLSQTQTRYLQNVAYIRMKNIQVGYNLPEDWLRSLRVKNSRIYVSGENLFTWSPLYKITRDLDVENIGRADVVEATETSGNGFNYPIMKSLSFGISVTF